ncbi:MAG TPA: hypothetical protein VNQ79_25365 [Blastocatellia bacterium]|nr:hypothetical protein [Blastocatellia bacterium]
MNFRLLVFSAALDALLASSILLALMQPVSAHPADRPDGSSAEIEKTTGILTQRIPARHLAKWQAIERLVFAEDATGQPLHPTLRSLYEWAEASGHAIYIELITESRLSSCTAGNFSIEHFDPQGERHEAAIKLYLANIDQAFIGESAQRTDGLIPFRGLRKEERYAEVLGHELAHAVDILSDLDRVRKVEELVEQTNELLLRYHAQRGGQTLSAEMRRRLSRRDSLLHELERRAESIEARVWRELTSSQPTRGVTPEPITSARR